MDNRKTHNMSANGKNKKEKKAKKEQNNKKNKNKIKIELKPHIKQQLEESTHSLSNLKSANCEINPLNGNKIIPLTKTNLKFHGMLNRTTMSDVYNKVNNWLKANKDFDKLPYEPPCNHF